MSILVGNPFLLNTTAATGYQVSRSLRFNSADSAYLSRTPTSAGNRKTFTWSAWVKRAKLGAGGYIFSCDPNSSNYSVLYWDTSTVIDALSFQEVSGGSQIAFRRSAAVFRDPSAWYHIVFVVDTTQATASNRIKMYVNGSQITDFNSQADPSQNADFSINSANQHNIGRMANFAVPFDGYLADIWFLDGIAATPSDFAETDATTGQWIPKTYSGSKGSNGFHLEFADNSAATAAALGKDTSGNSNNWTPNNFSVLTGAGNNGNWRNKLSNITYYSGSNITQWDEHLFRGVADNTGFSGYSGYPSDVTWTPATPISYTSSVRFLYDSYPAYTKYTLNGGAEQTTNGSWPPPAIGQWQTVATGSGTLTSLRLRTTSYDIGVHAIEIDGVVLKDINAAGNDSLVDTPSSYGTDDSLGGSVRGNYCVWNALDRDSGGTLSNGNLDWTSGGGGHDNVRATFFPQSGKWYWEITIPTITAGTGAVQVGIANPSATLTASGTNGDTYIYANNGDMYGLGSLAGTNSSFTGGDIIGMAYNRDANTLTFYKNGTVQSVSYSSISTTTQWAPFVNLYGPQVSGAAVANFGQRPYARSGGAPSGFSPLVDTLLATPVVAKPNTAFDVKLYTGSGSAQTVSGLNFSPDWVWLKSRSNAAYNHAGIDTVRGNTAILQQNLTGAEYSNSNYITSFNSNGFSLGTNTDINGSGDTFVAWCWDAGSSAASTNNSGSVTSTVKVNTTAGCSIVTWTGTGSGSYTVGHGLGVAPSFYVVKFRSAGSNWDCYHASLGNAYVISLNTTGASLNRPNRWNSTSPTSTVFSIGTDINDAQNLVAYCFAPVAGYSSFGSYTGNGTTDGPFVFCGFRPRWILVKRSDSTGNWYTFDTSRDSYNVANKYLLPNSSGAEGTFTFADITSNGFKVRDNSADWNASGGTILYAAFAESPFQYARAR